MIRYPIMTISSFVKSSKTRDFSLFLVIVKSNSSFLSFSVFRDLKVKFKNLL